MFQTRRGGGSSPGWRSGFAGSSGFCEIDQLVIRIEFPVAVDLKGLGQPLLAGTIAVVWKGRIQTDSTFFFRRIEIRCWRCFWRFGFRLWTFRRFDDHGRWLFGLGFSPAALCNHCELTWPNLTLHNKVR